MADFSALKTSIQNYIKQNGNEEITGNLLQQILLSMVSTLGDSAINDLVTALNAEIANRVNADTELGGSITTLQGVVNGIVANIQNGYVYAGIATPSTTPVSGKVFYLALTAGTYTNFGATVVPQGVNILKYNGSAWLLDSFLGLDDEPTAGSDNLVESGGVYEVTIKQNTVADKNDNYATGTGGINTDGTKHNNNSYTNYFFYNNGYKKIFIEVGVYPTLTSNDRLAIAFYTGTAYTGFISGIPYGLGTTNKRCYEVDVPSNCKVIIVSNYTPNLADYKAYFLRGLGGENYVATVVGQSLTENQKTNAKNNIGIGEPQVLDIVSNATTSVVRDIDLKPNTNYRITIPNFKVEETTPSNMLTIKVGNSVIYNLSYKNRLSLPPFVEVSTENDGSISVVVNDDNDIHHIFEFIECDDTYPVFASNKADMLNKQLLETNKDVEALKRSFNNTTGILCVDIQKKNNSSTPIELFDNSEVKSGDILEYSITMNAQNIVGYNGYIEFLNSEDERLLIIGKTSISDTSEVYSGTVEVPTGFAKAVLTGTGVCKLNYINKYALSTNNILSQIGSAGDIFKDIIGTICYHIEHKKSNTEELFDSTIVSVGDTILYNFETEHVSSGNSYIELLDSENTRLAIYGRVSIAPTEQYIYKGSFQIPNNFAKAVFRGSLDATLSYIAKSPANPILLSLLNSYKSDTDRDITYLLDAISHISGVENVNVINSVSFSGSPIQLISHNDQEATELDNKLINFASIVKVSDSMYYMYYSSKGTGTIGSGDSSQVVCFAYSTDGFTYHRGFPNGITPPIPGTNKLFSTTVYESHVCKVADANFPFRMIANTDNGDHIPTLFKSADGISFTPIRALDAGGGHDTQYAMVSRGNILKIYLRSYSTYQRSIGIMYCDLEGNILSPIKSAFDFSDTAFQPYNSGASLLDDHREILFPTAFNPNNNEETLTCVIVNQERFDIVSINPTPAVGTNKSFYAIPGLINIGTDMYLALAIRNTDHSQTTVGESGIQMIKVVLS